MHNTLAFLTVWHILMKCTVKLFRPRETPTCVQQTLASMFIRMGRTAHVSIHKQNLQINYVTANKLVTYFIPMTKYLA